MYVYKNRGDIKKTLSQSAHKVAALTHNLLNANSVVKEKKGANGPHFLLLVNHFPQERAFSRCQYTSKVVKTRTHFERRARTHTHTLATDVSRGLWYGPFEQLTGNVCISSLSLGVPRARHVMVGHRSHFLFWWRGGKGQSWTAASLFIHSYCMWSRACSYKERKSGWLGVKQREIYGVWMCACACAGRGRAASLGNTGGWESPPELWCKHVAADVSRCPWSQKPPTHFVFRLTRTRTHFYSPDSPLIQQRLN